MARRSRKGTTRRKAKGSFKLTGFHIECKIKRNSSRKKK